MDGEKSYRSQNVNTKDGERKVLSNMRNCVSHSERILFLTSEQSKQSGEQKKNKGDSKKMIIDDNYEDRVVGVVRSIDYRRKVASVRLLTNASESDVETQEQEYPFSNLRVLSRDEMRKIFKENYVSKNVENLERKVKEGTAIEQLIKKKSNEIQMAEAERPMVNVHGKSMFELLTLRSGVKSTRFSEVRRRSMGSNLVNIRERTKGEMSDTLLERSERMEEQIKIMNAQNYVVGREYRGMVEHVRYRRLVESTITDFEDNIFLEIRYKDSIVPIKLDYINFVSAATFTKMDEDISEKVFRSCLRELEDLLLDKRILFVPTIQKPDAFGSIHAKLYFDESVSQTVRKMPNDTNFIQFVIVNHGLAAFDPGSFSLPDAEYNKLVQAQQIAQSGKRGIWRYYGRSGLDSRSRQRKRYNTLPGRQVHSSIEVIHRSPTPSPEWNMRAKTAQGRYE